MLGESGVTGGVLGVSFDSGTVESGVLDKIGVFGVRLVGVPVFDVDDNDEDTHLFAFADGPLRFKDCKTQTNQRKAYYIFSCYKV